MNDLEVIAAIRANHLKANIAELEKAGFEMQWEKAYLDHGGTISGPGPYVKLPCRLRYDTQDRELFARFGIVLKETDWDERVIRVYAPERLRKRLAAQWERVPAS